MAEAMEAAQSEKKDIHAEAMYDLARKLGWSSWLSKSPVSFIIENLKVNPYSESKERMTQIGEAIKYVIDVLRSKTRSRLDRTDREILALKLEAAVQSETAPRVGLPLLYNLVCLWAQKKDDEWMKDMAELMRLADRLLYEQGYEVSPYTTNEHQVAADSPNDKQSETVPRDTRAWCTGCGPHRCEKPCGSYSDIGDGT